MIAIAIALPLIIGAGLAVAFCLGDLYCSAGFDPYHGPDRE